MKKIKLYEEFVGEAYKFYDLFFNSHIDHNPECDILEGHLDKDSLITYGIYVKGPKEGLEFMEYYSGSNYKPTSDKRSNSKLFMVDKIPAKYKAMWEDLKKIYENEYAGSGRVSTRNEALVTEGQFSWMAQDTGRQIGSERENTITVYMFDDKGQKWEEKKYDGYGEFGGKDYYELLAQMNGVENADRQDGIDIAFGKTKTKGKTLFPALVEDPKRFNYKRHDFTVQPDNDPNQSWYQEEEYEEDYYESVDESTARNVLKDAKNALTKTFAGKKLDKNYIKDYLKSIEMMARNNPMDFVKDYGEFTNDDWMEDVRYNMANEKVNEGRASADRLLKDVINGNASEVEGIKLSKDMAQGFADWLRYSTYGKKFGALPFDKLFTAAFNWGLDRFVKGANTKVKDEFKELKAKAKEMRKAEMKGESVTPL